MMRCTNTIVIGCGMLAGLACSSGGSGHDNTAGTAGSADTSGATAGSSGDDGGTTTVPGVTGGEPGTGASGQGGTPGGEATDGGDGVAQAGADGGDQPPATSAGAGVVCDGSSSLQLGFRSPGTGCTIDMPCPGAAVLGELGGNYLYLDAKCDLYLKPVTLGSATVRRLTPAELEDLVTTLRVAEWPESGTYCDNLVSTATSIFAFYGDGKVLQLAPCLDGNEVAVSAAVTNQYINAHHGDGQPMSGPVRYSLVPTEIPDHLLPSRFEGAETFPLDTLNVVNPSMTVSWGMTAPVMLAEGDDAASLRALLAGWLQKAGASPGDFIPVLDADDGSPLELRVRDVLPLEQNPGQPIF